MSLVSGLILTFYNKAKLRNIVSGFDKTSFVYNLQPYELVYLKTQKISAAINGTVNELIENGTIKVNADNSIELAKSHSTSNNSQLQVTSALNDLRTTFYPILLRKLVAKPIFWNIPNSMEAFRKYFNKSKKFGRLFYTNFAILGLLVLLSFTRIVTGILRDKPVSEIVMATIALIIITIIALYRLTKQISTKTIPTLYRKEILQDSHIEANWQWAYFLLGTTVLTTAFVPLVNHVERQNNSSGDGGSSGGSSCGSSCSSCGGCGGGD